MVDRGFWRGKRVLLTGHSGFKGSWMTLWLKSMGADVVGLSLAPKTEPSLFEIAVAGPGPKSSFQDIRDYEGVRSSVAAAQPEIVFHMAAQPLVRYSYENPVETYGVNVMGTVNLLEAVRQIDCVRAVVVVTTDKCYENKEWPWGYRENEALGGYDPYSNSKGCAELVTSAYRSSYFSTGRTAIASARAGNVIGGGDWSEDRLVPDILRAFEQGKSAIIRNPSAVRPWQHVLEPLSGYMMLAERLYLDGHSCAEAWNFGPHETDAKPVGWIADRMASIWGGQAAWSTDSGQHPHEATYLKLDISKAISKLGWMPRMSLVSALEKVVTWHMAYRQNANMADVCLEQIRQFEAEVSNSHGQTK